MTRPTERRSEAGFSLIEMMIGLIVLSVIMGAAVSVMRSQSRNFAKGGNRMELTQNLRYAVSATERLIRTLGGGIGTNQPMLVYAGNDVFTFNGNYASRLPDGVAVYVNPDIPLNAELSITTATPIVIPNTSPAVNYPVANYFWGGATQSRAETISIYFRPDSSTADPTDFVMLQRINATRSELIARNIRAYPGRPFFEYWWDSTSVNGLTTYKQLAAARIPVRNLVIGGATALSDSIRTVRLNLVVTNGDLTADSTSRMVSTMIQIPNNGLAPISTCGDTPLQPVGLLVTDTIGQGSGGVHLLWGASPDELGGERDIAMYNIYYRLQAVATWTPLTTQAPGFSPYTLSATLMADSTYFFAVAALDCSPAESPLLTSVATRLQP